MGPRIILSPWPWLVLVLTPLAALAADAPPPLGHSSGRDCPDVAFTVPLEPGLNDAEKRLICGRGEGEAWREIPHAQRAYHLRVFLQNRGYHDPNFILDGSHTLVDPGPRSVVQRVVTEGAPPEFVMRRKRDILGQPLTPQLLDELERWSADELGSLGYACARAKSSAEPRADEIRLKIESGPRLRVGGIVEEEIPGVAPGTLRRYDAFREGDWFDAETAELTERRVEGEGHVEDLQISVEKCTEKEVELRQSSFPGAPRLLTAAFGANTEGILLIRLSWRNTRLGRRASLIDVTARGSAKQQRLSTEAAWYPLSAPSRWFIRPDLAFEHENQDPWETVTIRAGVGPAAGLDVRHFGLFVRSGPLFERVRTVRGVGPENTRLLSLELFVRANTHSFEYYQFSPRSGFNSTFEFRLNDRNIGSELTAQRGRIFAEALWNFREYSPPLFVFGIRGAVATTSGGGQDPLGLNLPPSFRYFLGGSQDLRGFGSDELPRSGVGGLSSAFFGSELRWAGGVSPFGLEPLVFVDAGAIGVREFSLDPPVFWSPGAGVRWRSPIGVFRTTLAHGYVSGGGDGLSHLQFYFSYGEEF